MVFDPFDEPQSTSSQDRKRRPQERPGPERVRHDLDGIEEGADTGNTRFAPTAYLAGLGLYDTPCSLTDGITISSPPDCLANLIDPLTAHGETPPATQPIKPVQPKSMVEFNDTVRQERRRDTGFGMGRG